MQAEFLVLISNSVLYYFFVIINSNINKGNNEDTSQNILRMNLRNDSEAVNLINTMIAISVFMAISSPLSILLY